MKKLLLLVGLVVFLTPSILFGEDVLFKYEGDLPKCKIHSSNTQVLNAYACHGRIVYGVNTYYEGEFKNKGGMTDINLRHGQGTYYWPGGEKLVGEWEWGNSIEGTKFFSDGNKYVGEFNRKGKSHGQGTFIFSNGKTKSGLWENGTLIKETKVASTSTKKTATSEWEAYCELYPTTSTCVRLSQDNKVASTSTSNECKSYVNPKNWTNCLGHENFVDGGGYMGKYVNGAPNGKGTMTWPNGDRYKGEFKNWKLHGLGTLYLADGSRSEGRFKNDVLEHGQATIYISNGDKYVGEIKNDQINGRGTYYFANGKVKKGLWRNNKLIKEEKVASTNWGSTSTKKKTTTTKFLTPETFYGLDNTKKKNTTSSSGGKTYCELYPNASTCNGSYQSSNNQVASTNWGSTSTKKKSKKYSSSYEKAKAKEKECYNRSTEKSKQKCLKGVRNYLNALSAQKKNDQTSSDASRIRQSAKQAQQQNNSNRQIQTKSFGYADWVQKWGGYQAGGYQWKENINRYW